MATVIKMYFTLVPVIAAGVLNMAWCKSNVGKLLNLPIDGNKCYIDKKRIFGENKTFKGLIGMIVISLLCNLFWGMLVKIFSLENYSFLYINYDNTLLFNALIGLFFGFAYTLFELPNSFIKRRLNIPPGKRVAGIKGLLCAGFDQIDSLFGCVLVVAFVYKMSFEFYLVYVLLGGMTHALINVILFTCKLRKNII